MPILNSVIVFGSLFHVKLTDNIEDSAEGDIDFKSRIIEIDSKLCPSGRIEVLIHEVLHAYDFKWTGGISEKTEPDIIRDTTCLIDFLSANKELVAKILEDLP